MEPVHQKQRQETLQHTHKHTHTHSGRKGVIAILWHWQLLGFSQFLSFFLSATNISSTSDSSWSWLSTYPDIYIYTVSVYIYIPWGSKTIQLWCWCSHFCISLLFTLHPVPVQTYSGYRPNTVFAASATQSNWNLYSAAGVAVKRLGLTKFAMKFCSSLQCWRVSL